MASGGTGGGGTGTGAGAGVIVVNVKAGNQSHDLKVSICSTDSLKVFKEKVKIELKCPEKHLRLISSGKLLEPESASVSKLGLRDGSFVHAVISNQEPRQPTDTSRSPVTPTAPRPPVQYHGLDRLVETGLTIDETAALRSSFQQQIDEYSESHPRQANEDENTYRYRIEESWMRDQGPTSEFRLNLPRSRTSPSGFTVPSLQTFRSLTEFTFDDDGTQSNSGTFREFFWGLILGVSLGFLMIFCVWDRNVTAKQKLGIMVGISLHMMTGYFQNTTSVAHSTSSTAHAQHPAMDPSKSNGGSENEPVEISLDTMLTDSGQ